MPAPRSRRGLKGEVAAAAELGRLGYRIVDSNYHCRYGEIDLIAYDGDTLVFVEVRSRKVMDYGTPAESVTSRKQEKIILTAQAYLAEKCQEFVDCRFDVVTVIFTDDKPKIDLIKNAFGQ